MCVLIHINLYHEVDLDQFISWTRKLKLLFNCLLTDLLSASIIWTTLSLVRMNLLFRCFRTQQQRSDSPESSCVSMKSDRSKGLPIEFKGGPPAKRRSDFTLSSVIIWLMDAETPWTRASGHKLQHRVHRVVGREILISTQISNWN